MTTDLMKLTELCVSFKNAAEARLQGDVSLQQKAIASLKPGEMEELQSMAMELATGGLVAALSGKASDEFLKLNIMAADKVAELALRVMPEETLRTDAPDALKNAESARALTDAGAANLARLAGPR
jgi:hypothetical protein